VGRGLAVRYRITRGVSGLGGRGGTAGHDAVPSSSPGRGSPLASPSASILAIDRPGSCGEDDGGGGDGSGGSDGGGGVSGILVLTPACLSAFVTAGPSFDTSLSTSSSVITVLSWTSMTIAGPCDGSLPGQHRCGIIPARIVVTPAHPAVPLEQASRHRAEKCRREIRRDFLGSLRERAARVSARGPAESPLIRLLCESGYELPCGVRRRLRRFFGRLLLLPGEGVNRVGGDADQLRADAAGVKQPEILVADHGPQPRRRAVPPPRAWSEDLLSRRSLGTSSADGQPPDDAVIVKADRALYERAVSRLDVE